MQNACYKIFSSLSSAKWWFMEISWWVWVIIGVTLLLAELLSPGGFFLLFFGLTALLLSVVGLVLQPDWIEVFLFAVISTLSIYFFRKPLQNCLNKSTPQANMEEFVGHSAKTLTGIDINSEGMVEFRGTSWKAINSGNSNLVAGQNCEILRREGLTFIIQAKAHHP